MNILNSSRDLAWLRDGTTDVTNARTCPFFAVYLTIFSFEFRPRTLTVGFYGKIIYQIRAYDFRMQFSFDGKRVVFCASVSVLIRVRSLTYQTRRQTCLILSASVHVLGFSSSTTNVVSPHFAACYVLDMPTNSDGYSFASTSRLRRCLASIPLKKGVQSDTVNIIKKG